MYLRTLALTVYFGPVILCTILYACTLIYWGPSFTYLAYWTILCYIVLQWSAETVNIAEARMNASVFGSSGVSATQQVRLTQTRDTSSWKGYECNRDLDVLLIVY